MVRGPVRERFCEAPKGLRAFSTARVDKITNDRTHAPDGQSWSTPASRTDKTDKKARGWMYGRDAEDERGWNVYPESDAGARA